MTPQELTAELGGKWHGRTGKALCPAHEDHDPSLDIAPGDTREIVFVCRAGCSQANVLSALRTRGILLNGEDREEQRHRSGSARPQMVATFRYTATDGTALRKRRWESGLDGKRKSFEWQHGHCFAGCPQTDILRAIHQRFGADRDRDAVPVPATVVPQRTQFAELSPEGRAVWRRTLPVTADCPAYMGYLAPRGVACPPDGSDLRWLPDLRHPSGHVGPALVGLVTDTLAASLWINLHQTWVTLDGTGEKAPVDRPRLLLWNHRKKGGVVRLWPDCDVTQGLGVAEGVESALALAARGFRPVWSVIDASNLVDFPILPGIEALTIAYDTDPEGAGQRAALACSERWEAEGREVYFVWAQQEGGDLADPKGPVKSTLPSLPDPVRELEILAECKKLGLSEFGSSAVVRELPR